MTRRHHALGALWALGAAVAGCGGDPAPPSDGGGADAALLGGCADGDFVDATPLIQFGGEGGGPIFMYTPRCLSVAPTNVVRFAGDFSVHPLSPGTSPGVGPPGNPIPRTNVGRELDVAFPDAGTFPFFCEYHYGAGMRGAVRVMP